MKEEDPLDSVLREWNAPAPSSALDARVRAAYREIHRPSPWRFLWSARVTIPVPVLAALMLIVAVLWIAFRPGTRPVQPPTTVAAPNDGYTTRIESAGFIPLPDGATRVIRSEVKQ